MSSHRYGADGSGTGRSSRRAIALRDAEIVARTRPDPELAGLAEHALRLGTLLDLQEQDLSAAFDLD